jgi:hypothetical protein
MKKAIKLLMSCNLIYTETSMTNTNVNPMQDFYGCAICALKTKNTNK